MKLPWAEKAAEASGHKFKTFKNYGAFIQAQFHDEHYLEADQLKVASFDLDWTIIKTKSGATFPKSKDDWELLFGKLTHEVVNQLHKDGFKIVIFTNQAGVAIGRTKPADLEHKFSAIQAELGVPMIFLASTQKESAFRKPQTGMWKVLVKDIFKNKPVDKVNSFYCGDAAGRKQKPFNDFSSDDLLYSINLGLKFYTPEMLF